MRFTDNTAIALALLESRQDKALEECGERAVGFAKAICPVDTGRLQASITHRVDRDSAVIGTDVEYAMDVELGTGRYRPGWNGPKHWAWQDRHGGWHITSGQRPQPYLRPAVSDHDSAYAGVIRQVLRGS